MKLKAFFSNKHILSLTLMTLIFQAFLLSTCILNGRNILASNFDIEEFKNNFVPTKIDLNLIDQQIQGSKKSISTKVYSIKRGDTLTSIWKKHNASYAGAIKAAEAFQAANISLSSLRMGSSIELQFSNEGDITGVRKKLTNGRVLILSGNSNKGYETNVLVPEIVKTKKKVSGTIYSSFSSAARDMEVPYGVIDELIDLFGSRLEFSRDLRTGDTFCLIYEEQKIKGGNKLPHGDIIAASIVNQGNLLVAIKYEDKNGEARYYNQDGDPVGSYFLRYPVKFSRISSVFSHSRLHPVLKIRRPHYGVDFAAPYGTPIRAVADGTIIKSTYSRSAGRWIKIKHSKRYSTAYLHLSKFAKGMKSGAKVRRGQVIGFVGSTGYSTGPHLDFRFYDNGKYVDPLRIKLPVMPDKGEKIPTAILASSLEELKSAHEKIKLALNSYFKKSNT